MITKLLLAVLATAVLAQSQFGGDNGDDSNRRGPPRPDGQGPRGQGGQGQGGQGQGGQRQGQGQDGERPGPPGRGQGGPSGQGRDQRQNDGNSNGMRILDPKATLLAIISLGPEQKQRDQCGKWGDWKEVKCWWPDQNFSSLPEECTNITYPKKVPQQLRKFIDAKVQEVYAVIQAAYQKRGAPPKCGHCTHSFKCRTRNATKEDDDDDDMDMGDMGMDFDFGMNDDERDDDSSMEDQGPGRQGEQGRHPRPRPRPRPRPGKQCKKKEIRPIDADCADEKACKVSSVFGGCPAPLFLHKDQMKKINEMMMNGDHQGALDAMDYMQNGGGDDEDTDDSMRKKRQSGFYDPSTFYGYSGRQEMGSQMQIMGPWQPNNDWTGSSQSQNPFLQWRRQERGMDSYSPMSGFSPRFSRQYGDFGDDGYRQDWGQGSQRRPWGPSGGDERSGGRSWDRDDDRRGSGGSDWNRRPWGPPGGGRGGDDDRRPPWGPSGRGDDDRRRPWGPRDDDRRGGRGGDDRRRPWGPPDRDDDRRPWGPPGRDDDRRRPWGPGGADDRRGPGHRGGPGSSEEGPRRDDRRGPGHRGGPGSSEEGPRRDDRRGPGHRGGSDSSEEGPRRRFDNQRNPPSRGQRWNNDQDRRPKFGGGGDDESGEMDHRRGGHGRGGKGKAKFIANLLHGTNCVSSGKECLCCCGGYIPDAASGDCKDIRSMMPQLPKLLDFAMKKDPSQ